MTSTADWLKTGTLQDAVGHGLREDEYKRLTEVLGRDLNLVEIGICSALFSEHCSYKSTKVHLKTLPIEGPEVLQGPGENAGIVDIGDGQAVAFKVESHNHPTFIEPFQGAATGVGGILRDVFTMGARPLALMNSLRFGEPSNERTPYLLSRAVAGIGGYGNCIGVPTIGGETFFHKAYNGNCLVNAFALGLVDHDAIFRGFASGPGNSIVYVGSKTGRDGIHGATMASEEFDDDSDEKRPTVQVGDPFQEKLLLEACLEAMKTDVVVGIQDMGAAGMTSSTFEMAERAGTGVRIDLDKVPQRESGMNPYEIMLSESQERMILVVEQGKEQEILDIFEHWELDGVIIGEVTDGNSVDLYWHGERVCDIPVELVTSSVPEYRWPEEEPSSFKEVVSLDDVEEPKDLSSIWASLVSSENLCSRNRIYDQYDSTVRTNTVIHPGGDAAVIRIKSDSEKPDKGVAMTLDCNSRYCQVDPRQGTALTMAEACRNLAAVGARPIGISDCLNFGSPERPEGMWQIAESIRGLGEAGRAFKVPVISGNVSLYNETKGSPILPTPTLAVVGLIEDASKCVPADFQNTGDKILVIGEVQNELGGSEYLAQHFGIEKGPLPTLDYDLEMKTADLVRSLIDKQLLNSCHDVSGGGLAIALAECSFGMNEPAGATLEAEAQSSLRSDVQMFAESGGRYIVSCSPDKEDKVRAEIDNSGLAISFSGEIGGPELKIGGLASIDVKQSHSTWSDGLDKFFD